MPTAVEVIDSVWSGGGTKNLAGSIFRPATAIINIRAYSFLNLNTEYFVREDSLSGEGYNFNETLNIGDLCQLATNDNKGFQFVVTSVYPNTIHFDIVPDSVTNINFPRSFNGPDQLYVLTPLEAIKYDWGLNSVDSQSSNYISYLDGQTLSYDVDIPLDGGYEFGRKTAVNANFGSLLIRRLPNTVSPLFQYDEDALIAQNFEISHTFIVTDYNAEDIQNYIDRIKPDNYLGDNTLNYNSRFSFRSDAINPETTKLGEYRSLGNVGYFDERFNGGANPYSISNLEYYRASNNEKTDSLSSSEPTIVRFRIDGFLDAAAVTCTHFTLEQDYVQKNIPFTQLFNYDSIILRLGVPPSNANIFKSQSRVVSIDSVGTNMELYIDVAKPTIDGTDYFISVLVDDIQLLIDVNQYFNGFDIEGLVGDAELGLSLMGCNEFASSFPMIKAETINTRLYLPIIDGEITSIDLQTLSINNGEIYEIDSQAIDITGFLIIDGVQRINEIIPSPYIGVPDGSIKWIDGKNYEIIAPYRMPFSKLQAVRGLPDVLFDTNEPNNGFNEDVFYQQGKGFNIHIAYRVGIKKDGKVTLYRFRSPVIQVKDFEQSL